jgi:hypothetical protein
VLGGLQVRADLHGGIGRAGMQRAAVVGGDDRNRGDPFGLAGTEDAQRDLTAIRYEQALHRGDSNLVGTTPSDRARCQCLGALQLRGRGIAWEKGLRRWLCAAGSTPRGTGTVGTG